MIYTIEYSKDADKTLRKWKKSNPRLFKKATKILLEQHYKQFDINSKKTITIMRNTDQSVPDVVHSLLGAGEPVVDEDLNARDAYNKYLKDKYK